MSANRAAILPLALLLAGCGLIPGLGSTEPVEDPLSLGLVALDRQRFDMARSELEEVAAACPAGEGSADALLLLAAMYLDPRYEERDPTTAARYAARVIRREVVPAITLEFARSLYMAARDIGAPALEGPPRADEPMVWLADLEALPVPACADVDAVAARPLPTHPGPVLAASVALARAALDSATAVPQPTGEPVVETDTSKEERLQAEVDRLNAELQRIRRLLRGGG